MIPIFTVLNFIKDQFNKKNLSRTLMIAIAIMGLFMYKGCNENADLQAELEHKELVAANNYEALTGEVKQLKTKNGELEYSKTILYTDAEELEKLNSNLAKELKKEKGNVKVITDVQTEIKLIPVTVPNEVKEYGNDKYGLAFTSTYRDSGLYSQIEGISGFHIDNNKIIPDSTSITKNILKVDVIYGMRERDDKIEIFARSASPYVSFNEIQGAYITTKGNSILPNDKPTPRVYNWALGPQFGYTYVHSTGMQNVQFLANLQYRASRFTYGLQAGTAYSLGADSPDLRIGFRIQYNLFRW
jgi:hypothetical protein